MCSTCKPIMPDFSIEHSETQCPLRNSMYCSNCAAYGHRTVSCPARPALRFREPCYIEQLLCPTDLAKYNITSKTPIPSYAIEEPQRLLEIKDDDKVISAYLHSRGIKPVKGCTKRYLLEEYAKSQNRRLILL